MFIVLDIEGNEMFGGREFEGLDQVHVFLGEQGIDDDAVCIVEQE